MQNKIIDIMEAWRKSNTNKYNIIGLKGPKTVGKTTYANKLNADGKYFIVPLAAPIKYIVHSVVETKSVEQSKRLYKKYLKDDNLKDMNKLMNDLLQKTLTDKVQMSNKESLRQYYQIVGDIMRNENINIFILIALDTISSQDIKDVIIDDIRQYNEAFICSKLYLLNREGVHYTNEHISEMPYTDNELQVIESYVKVISVDLD